jgi:tetratricopeptide (TPR) repeat protein
MDHFRRAIELDPAYALAYSGLADTYTLLGSYGLLPMSEAYPLGRAAALKALELDDSLGEAHNSLAAIKADYYWDWADAERHFRRAIELSPNDATPHRFYSFYLACMGRHQEALAVAERARRVDPVSPLAQMNVATILYFARRYDEAIAEITDSLDLAPDFAPARILLGRIYVAKGSPERAVAELKHADDLMGPRPDVTTPFAWALARTGRQREARAMLDELRRISKPRDPAPIRLAVIHIGLGERDRAFEWLEKAFEARDWQMALLNVEPLFDTVRSDPRFAALVARVGLPRWTRVSTSAHYLGVQGRRVPLAGPPKMRQVGRAFRPAASRGLQARDFTATSDIRRGRASAHRSTPA